MIAAIPSVPGGIWADGSNVLLGETVVGQHRVKPVRSHTVASNTAILSAPLSLALPAWTVVFIPGRYRGVTRVVGVSRLGLPGSRTGAYEQLPPATPVRRSPH
jgi:hypothetical protein